MLQELGTLNGPLLIFGGPYSNLAATQAVKQVAEQQGIPAHRVICTGDIVAYCAEPQETVDLIREWGCHVVMGNCEESLAADAPDCGCGFDEGSACSLLSVEWYNFASQRVSSASKQWMATLPRQLRFRMADQQFHVVHGSVDSINEFVFASDCADNKQRQLDEIAADVVIGGHCGIPFGQRLNQGYWLNAGVIGMPANDATPDGWYMLLEVTEGKVEVSWQRLAYASQTTVAAMQQANVGLAYADCLRSGHWPNLDVLPEAERAMLTPLALEPIRL